MTSIAIEASGTATLSHTTCAHCGLPVPPGLIERGAAQSFCCSGCRTAFDVLREAGLDAYYSLPERREQRVVTSGRSFEEFDHPTFHRLHVRATANGLAQVELYLEGVHCGSCVWLVERVPLIIPGVARSELDIRRSRATVEWDATAVPLSRIARVLDSLGYTPHPFRGARRAELRRREERRALAHLGIAGALAINVMLASLALYSGWWSGMEPAHERYFRWVSLLLTAPALLIPGRVFFVSAFAALRTRRMHMDVPIAIALAAGFGQGAINTITDAGPIYLDGVAMLIFLLLCGRYLQQRGQRAATDAAELLYALTPRTARLVRADQTTQDVPAEAVVPGQVVEVRSGESLPADGVVESGTSTIDVALLTGESEPVPVQAGERVYAGTVNIAAPLRVRVTATGEESRVARLMRQVEEGAQRRAPIVLLADRLAGWFTATVIVLAAAAWYIWTLRDPARALDIAIALLVVTCPCALALATPLAISASIGRAARGGIFIKGGAAVEALAQPGVLFLDKTGTVTQGRATIVQWMGSDEAKALTLALERGSTHPIAVAFREAFGDQPVPEAAWVRHVVGGGVEGVVNGRSVVVGSPRFVSERGARCPNSALVDETLTPVWVAVDGQVVGVAGVGDAIRPDARETIAELRRRGWHVQILSGDAPGVVHSVGRALGLAAEDCRGGLSPECKLEIVERARRSEPVVMVGDGINDAAAMAAASVGVGVHGGAEASLATADVYLTRPGLSALAQLIDGSQRTFATIRRGMLLSLAYNVVGVTLALSGAITPLMAAVLMPASSLTVLLVAWRGRSFPGAPA
ncbi:MAG TPA: heavy metal translocating P-type ATPase [Gemmatimonadaceae bacterium]